MSRFDFTFTRIPGLMLVQRKAVEDSRGILSRFYCAEEFRGSGLDRPIVQINHTVTYRSGTVRGMHFQYPPHVDAKLVSCLSGEIWDVAVDIRRGSPTFLQWYGEILNAANRRSLLIPAGFAHGYQALTDDCELIYLHTGSYCPEAEGGLNAVDPELKIAWPLPVGELSERDRCHPYVGRDFQGVQV